METTAHRHTWDCLTGLTWNDVEWAPDGLTLQPIAGWPCVAASPEVGSPSGSSMILRPMKDPGPQRTGESPGGVGRAAEPDTGTV